MKVPTKEQLELAQLLNNFNEKFNLKTSKDYIEDPVNEIWLLNIDRLSYFQFHGKVQKISKKTLIMCIQGPFKNGEVSLHFPDEN